LLKHQNPTTTTNKTIAPGVGGERGGGGEAEAEGNVSDGSF